MISSDKLFNGKYGSNRLSDQCTHCLLKSFSHTGTESTVVHQE